MNETKIPVEPFSKSTVGKIQINASFFKLYFLRIQNLKQWHIVRVLCKNTENEKESFVGLHCTNLEDFHLLFRNWNTHKPVK